MKMVRIIPIFCFASVIISSFLLVFSCTAYVRPKPTFIESQYLTNVVVPSAEDEKKIVLSINFNGKWRKASTGSKSMIVIDGKAGKIIAANGGQIPIIVRYISNDIVKIYETQYNPDYLSNWLPPFVAQEVYQNEAITNTYSILKIIDKDTLVGIAYSWQVQYDSNIVESISQFITNEEWIRVTN